jgi:hypothetical protein
MSNEIFQEIYEISLLNLYIYTDCAMLMTISPPWLSYSFLGTGINEKIHLINYNDFLSPERTTLDEIEKGYPLWETQLKKNVEKIGHIYIDSLYKPVSILLTKKNNNLFVTFRGTCNYEEAKLDVEIFIKNHLLGAQTILDKLNTLIEEIYNDLNTMITLNFFQEGCDNIIFSGHSLGAIICILFVLKLISQNAVCIFDHETKLYNKYFMCLLGMPSIGNQLFVDRVEKLIGNNYINICNNGDFMIKASSTLIPNLNNVIQYHTTQLFNCPLCEKIVHINLGDNNITNFYNSKWDIIKLFKIHKVPSSIISHSILKYVENIYFYLQNKSTDKLKLNNKGLSGKFNNIFEKLNTILKVSKPYTHIVFNGGHNKSQKKIKRTRKSKKCN